MAVRITRPYAIAATALIGLGLSQAAAVAASATDYPVEIAFASPASATIEYGQYWYFEVSGSSDYYYNIYSSGNSVVTATGTPSGYQAQQALYGSFEGTKGQLSAGYDVAPLGAGTYTFSIGGTTSFGEDSYTGKTPSPATLIVEKAKLGVELRVLADPSNGDAAIVTAKFTGRFVDEYQSSFFAGAAQSPAGTWSITVKDADGEVAIERNVERAAGDDVLATSFYWADAEPGQQYTASAAFVPSGNSASNFSIGAAQNFAYTAPEEQRPVPTSTATEKPDASLPEATGFGLPLWTVILVAVLIVALGVLVTILSVRLSRRPSPSAKEVSE